jgi:hypothetical protein
MAAKFAQTIKTPQLKLTSSDSTNALSIYTIGANGGIVKAIWATSNDATSRWITIMKNDGTKDGLVLSLKFPAAVTNVPIQAVNFLDPSRLTFLEPYDIQWHVESGHSFKAKMETAITAAAEVTIYLVVGEY